MEDKEGLISVSNPEVVEAAVKEDEQEQDLQSNESDKTGPSCSNKESPSAKLSNHKSPVESAAKIIDDKIVDEMESSKSTAPISNFYHKFVSSFDAVLQNIIGEEDPPKKVMSSLDIEGIANYIKEEGPRNVIFMVGAGISTSAGVPDFRSPGTGLYDNLQKFNLPDQQSIFDIAFFKTNPEPFYILARELFREDIIPTCAHFFMRLFEEKGMLRRVFTQNIDTLEHIAGIPEERIVTAHGSFMTSTCQKCKKKYNQQWLSERLKDKDNVVARCESCNGVVKPDIVFFGERLPNRFFSSVLTDFPKCDLLIIMGSSLIVQPFASLVQQVNCRTPRLLINITPVGQSDLVGFYNERSENGPLRYGKEENDTDVFHQSSCDEGCMKLARLLGWEDELKHLMEKHQSATVS